MDRPDTRKLTFVYDGWQGYNTSLLNALDGLTPENLAFRVGEGARSVGEVFLHISEGRVEWFSRMGVQRAAELAKEFQSSSAAASAATDVAALKEWLRRSWEMVQTTLEQWTVDDLTVTFEQPYDGKVYSPSRQWVVWRILSHDIHHGGQITELLGMQGIWPTELAWLGGHIVEPPLAP